MDIGLQILSAIFVASISSWITVQLSLRKSLAEKWWEKKVLTYQSVLEALHNSKRFTEVHMSASSTGSAVSEEVDIKLREQVSKGTDEILRTADIGAFFLSSNAMDRLKRYQKESNEASDCHMWYDYLDSDFAAIDSCLKDLIKIVKTDLRTKAL